eukprot:7614643-Prorocentrum_lima.AAC.1
MTSSETLERANEDLRQAKEVSAVLEEPRWESVLRVGGSLVGSSAALKRPCMLSRNTTSRMAS